MGRLSVNKLIFIRHFATQIVLLLSLINRNQLLYTDIDQTLVNL